MAVTVTVITFGATAVQLSAPAGVPATVRRILIEPVRANTHACWVGTAAVTNDGSGTGVIQELAQPPAATIPLDRFDYIDHTGSNRLDPTDFWVHGTSGEKATVAYFKI